MTALHLAGESNNTDIIDLLLSQQGIKIGDDCFKECKKLTRISISSFVTEIGNSAFEGCSMLSEMSIPPSVTNIQRMFISERSNASYVN